MEINIIAIIIGFIVSFFLFSKFPLLNKNSCKKKDYKISIIIPSRNEENNIDNILNDLEKQTYNIHEIICVDDNSQDNTADVIKKHNVKYLLVDNLKDDWKGKPWACQNGANIASGDILLFIDSDVRFSSTAVESLVSKYEKSNNPLSVQPYHVVNKFYEYFSYFFNLIQICATSLSIYKQEKYVGFYGPVFMIDKKLFLDNGGYEPVKDRVVEDLHLGKYYNSLSINVDLELGGDEIKFKMYPKGFFQLLEGWSKNFSQASVSIDLKLFLMVFFWVSYLSALPIEIRNSIVLNNYFSLIVEIIIYIITVIKLRKDTRKIGSFPFVISLLFPFYLVAFVVIFFYSLFKTYFFKSTTWKGRKL